MGNILGKMPYLAFGEFILGGLPLNYDVINGLIVYMDAGKETVKFWLV